LPNVLHQPLLDVICHAVRSAICLAGVAGLIGGEPVPELGVVAVRVEQRIRAIRLHHLGIGDGVRLPPVVGNRASGANSSFACARANRSF
jgi:hypothetical protein